MNLTIFNFAGLIYKEFIPYLFNAEFVKFFMRQSGRILRSQCWKGSSTCLEPLELAMFEQIANFFAHLSWTKHVFFLRFLWRDTFQLSFFTSVNSGCTTNLNSIVEFQGIFLDLATDTQRVRGCPKQTADYTISCLVMFLKHRKILCPFY